MWAIGLLVVLLSQAEPQATGAANALDLSKAVVVAPEQGLPAKAAEMLADEIEERAGVRLDKSAAAPDGDQAAIVLTAADRAPAGLSLPSKDAWRKPDGYAIVVARTEGAPRIWVVGHDDRGVLFGAGRLLRFLRLEQGRVALDPSVQAATAPAYPVRGHQLGYRATNNTYDRWTLEEYEQYLRDLIAFGANAVELTVSTDPEPDQSPLMKVPPEEMNAKLTELFHSYGLESWLWLPIRGDVSKAADAEKELEAQRALFEKMPYVDAVFVPGGDPGDTAPNVLMPFLERMAAGLKAVHPEATLWLSNQGFDDEQNAYLFDFLERNKPVWLAGLVFGPWTRMTLPDMRGRTPSQYPIRRYPDVCHCVRCEYPVPQWDRAFAHTLGREPFNPRPKAYAHIHNSLAKHSNGFISYSDGVNDDVNKFIWTALAWDPTASVDSILRDYGEYLIGAGYGEPVAKGLLMLEDNWVGPLARNERVEATLAHWQGLEDKASPEVRNNWRFQLCMLRACYDAYTRRRLLNEQRQEAEALAALGAEPAAIEAARKALEPSPAPDAQELRRRIEDLGERLYRGIGMQLDVARYGALNPERGAVLEALDAPLNDRAWLRAQFDALLKESDSQRRVDRMEALVNWEEPGPGGFYDDLGNAPRELHLVRDVPWEEDPGFIESPQDEFSRGQDNWRLSWRDQAQTLYGTPLRLRYEGLKPDTSYRLRVIYAGRFNAKMRLTADDRYEIHGPLGGGQNPEPQEFAVPVEATQDGVLDLRWDRIDGRGCQVAEVWLSPAPAP